MYVFAVGKNDAFGDNTLTSRVTRVCISTMKSRTTLLAKSWPDFIWNDFLIYYSISAYDYTGAWEVVAQIPLKRFKVTMIY